MKSHNVTYSLSNARFWIDSQTGIIYASEIEDYYSYRVDLHVKATYENGYKEYINVKLWELSENQIVSVKVGDCYFISKLSQVEINNLGSLFLRLSNQIPKRMMK